MCKTLLKKKLKNGKQEEKKIRNGWWVFDEVKERDVVSKNY